VGSVRRGFCEVRESPALAAPTSRSAVPNEEASVVGLSTAAVYSPTCSTLACDVRRRGSASMQGLGWRSEGESSEGGGCGCPSAVCSTAVGERELDESDKKESCATVTKSSAGVWHFLRRLPSND